MPISPARAAAFEILLRMERESSFASELLHSQSLRSISAQDHALATELAMGVLRWRSLLDDEIASASSQRIAKLDLEVLTALRLALYQLRFLDRIPPRAALYESVELVKHSRKKSAASFVNAVLRKLSSARQKYQPTSETTPESLARSFAHPLWLVQRWADEYGLASARQICEYDQSLPKTAIRLRSTTAEQQLNLAGVKLAPGSILRSARIVQSGDVTTTAAFRQREIVVQDEGSQLVAMLVGHGSNILDCCAAPGNKTLAISDRNPESTITAVELHPHRTRVLKKLLGARPNERIRIVAADARQLPLSRRYDRILTDVPCSGTGTLARHPEIKWRLQPNDLLELRQRQVAILLSALAQLSLKGRLVYSTCSLQKEENECVVEQVLAESHSDSVRVLDCKTELEKLKADQEICWHETPLTRGPYLRTIPGIHPCDGFFAALLEKS
ncbi:MAG TPA: transcription antitermination factor NusB [Verrucomicrobiae bacterium]|nr:transcription antitermination factor NusB [Verrucomicrobiae bacterium]